MSLQVKASALILVVIALALSTRQAEAHHRGLQLTYLAPAKVLHLKWSGKIDWPLADRLRDILKEYDLAAHKLVFTISSGGGRVSAARKIIKLLRRFRKTHQLEMVVLPGQICGSMCVPIFLQGARRKASVASLWLFHEIATRDPVTGKTVRLRPRRTARMFDDYFIPAGVPRQWINKLSRKISGNDIWLTGAQLLQEGSHIINQVISNRRQRRVYRRGGNTAAAVIGASAGVHR